MERFSAAITGIGLVTPAGIGTPANWKRVVEGKTTAAIDRELAQISGPHLVPRAGVYAGKPCCQSLAMGPICPVRPWEDTMEKEIQDCIAKAQESLKAAFRLTQPRDIREELLIALCAIAKAVELQF